MKTLAVLCCIAIVALLTRSCCHDTESVAREQRTVHPNDPNPKGDDDDSDNNAPVPEPLTMTILGAGLAGVYLVRRKQRE
jgi:PEP-CTERM motif-containing protein